MSARGGEAAALRERAILEERARALARPPAAEAHAAGRLLVVRLVLSGEAYAVEADVVRAVARIAEYTVVPGAPPVLFGVANHRGEVLPVFDLRRLTGRAARGLSDLSRMLVLGDDVDELGLVADEVHDVRALGRDEVLEPPAALAALGREVILGVTADATTVLSGRGLLRDRRLYLARVRGEERR